MALAYYILDDANNIVSASEEEWRAFCEEHPGQVLLNDTSLAGYVITTQLCGLRHDANPPLFLTQVRPEGGCVFNETVTDTYSDAVAAQADARSKIISGDIVIPGCAPYTADS